MSFTRKFREIAKNSNLRCQMAVAFGVSYFSIRRWLDEDGFDELTKPKYLEDLVRITGVPADEIFEKQTV